MNKLKNKTKSKKVTIGVGMPESLYFQEFGQLIWEVFGEIPFHVGSSLSNKEWRDVDVRLMLSDDLYRKMGFGDPANPHCNAKWCGLVKAFSALGEKMTGLPIDFQIQQMTFANKTYKSKDGHLRSALFIIKT